MPRRFLAPELIRTLDYVASVVRKVHLGELQGGHWSARPGTGMDFKDYRAYSQGDDPRRIDWNLYARLGRLLVKIFHDEEDVDIHLVIDTSASMNDGHPTKLRVASQLAAALGYLALVGQERVSLWSLNEGRCKGIPASKGPAQIKRIFDVLFSLQSLGGTGLNLALLDLINQTPRGGLYLLFTDFLDPNGWETGLEALAGRRRCEIQVFHPASREECEPPWEGAVELKDPESDATLSIHVDKATRVKYEESWRARLEEVKRFCLRREIPHVFLTTDTPVDTALLGFLRRRGIIK